MGILTHIQEIQLQTIDFNPVLRQFIDSQFNPDENFENFLSEAYRPKIQRIKQTRYNAGDFFPLRFVGHHIYKQLFKRDDIYVLTPLVLNLPLDRSNSNDTEFVATLSLPLSTIHRSVHAEVSRVQKHQVKTYLKFFQCPCSSCENLSHPGCIKRTFFYTGQRVINNCIPRYQSRQESYFCVANLIIMFRTLNTFRNEWSLECLVSSILFIDQISPTQLHPSTPVWNYTFSSTDESADDTEDEVQTRKTEKIFSGTGATTMPFQIILNGCIKQARVSK